MKRVVLAAATATAMLGLTGCNPYTGMNSLPLPGTEGTGPNSYEIKVQLHNADDLVANTPVYYKDMNVGTTTYVGLDGWTPTLTLSIRDDIKLPANATAALAQTSLLGSKHIDLLEPTTEPSQGELQPGAVIKEDRIKQFPETEDLLAGVSALLNGGGLQHFQTITTELNRALGNGRDKDARELLTQLNNFTDGLDKQTQDITFALHGFDNLGSRFLPRLDDIDKGLQQLPAGLDTLNDLEPQFVKTLTELSGATKELAPFADEGTKQLEHVFKDLKKPLKAVGDVQPGTPYRALQQVSGVIFIPNSTAWTTKGDYANITALVNLGLDSLDKNLLGGTPLAGSLYNIAEAQRNFRLPGAKSPSASNKLPIANPAEKLPLPGPLGSKVPLDAPIAPKDPGVLPSLPKLGK
jgi:phospholipid/cholesterol/gamma-HCH transport system substrate-binding protein